jgi:phosphoribosylamine-glycine ligase
MNIMSLFSGDWPHVMEQMCDERLSAQDVPLREEASVVLYLVSPDYALRKGGPYEFELDEAAIAQQGCEVFFSSAVRESGNRYRTVGTSRAVALASTAPQLQTATDRVRACAATIPVLEWREDIGDPRYLEGLRGLLAAA